MPRVGRDARVLLEVCLREAQSTSYEIDLPAFNGSAQNCHVGPRRTPRGQKLPPPPVQMVLKIKILEANWRSTLTESAIQKYTENEKVIIFNKVYFTARPFLDWLSNKSEAGAGHTIKVIEEELTKLRRKYDEEDEARTQQWSREDGEVDNVRDLFPVGSEMDEDVAGPSCTGGGAATETDPITTTEPASEHKEEGKEDDEREEYEEEEGVDINEKKDKKGGKGRGGKRARGVKKGIEFEVDPRMRKKQKTEIASDSD